MSKMVSLIVPVQPRAGQTPWMVHDAADAGASCLCYAGPGWCFVKNSHARQQLSQQMLADPTAASILTTPASFR